MSHAKAVYVIHVTDMRPVSMTEMKRRIFGEHK